MARFGMNLPEDLEAAMLWLAEAQHISASEAVRRAINNEVSMLRMVREGGKKSFLVVDGVAREVGIS